VSTYSYEFLVRQEQNRDLVQEAAFERWLAKIAFRQDPREPLGSWLVRQAKGWLEGQTRTIRCTDSAPACGLLLAG
jgi:hypothetical protein